MDEAVGNGNVHVESNDDGVTNLFLSVGSTSLECGLAKMELEGLDAMVAKRCTSVVENYMEPHL